jgi:hypothetical protein
MKGNTMPPDRNPPDKYARPLRPKDLEQIRRLFRIFLFLPTEAWLRWHDNAGYGGKIDFDALGAGVLDHGWCEMCIMYLYPDGDIYCIYDVTNRKGYLDGELLERARELFRRAAAAENAEDE